MTFFNWMMQHKERQTPAGQLARDMHMHRAIFPRVWEPTRVMHDMVRIHMACHGADEETLAVFEDCWREWEADRG